MQRWAEDVAGQPVPPSSHDRAAFEALPRGILFRDALLKVGAPVEQLQTDGALQIFVWDLEDGDRIQIATPDLDRVQYVEWVTRGGKRVRLMSD